MKAFITGGTGFIGRYLIPKLVARGYEVWALARSESGMEQVKASGAIPVSGDILDKESMRAGMSASDVVFHVAGWYELGTRNWQQGEKINVDGTRNVLSLAVELGIPRIIYTSTVAVFGDTHGRIVDESYQKPAEQGFLTEYDRTKWLAHYRVALPLIEKGAPVIILMPGAVYGPGDHSLVGELMRRYYQGLFPIFPAPDLVLTYAHVEDIAEAHVLAAEKGRVGESYIIAGPAVPMREMVKLWSRLTGRREPFSSISGRYLKPFAPVMEAIQTVLPLPPLFSRDSLAILDVSYAARSDKAFNELGWRPRPLEEGMRETLDWIAESERSLEPERRQRLRLWLALGVAAGLLAVWLVNKRRD